MVHEKIENEIRKANTLFASYGQALSLDPGIRALGSDYFLAIQETGRAMAETGVAATCTACAEKGPGACCFQGIEAGYDHILLLANLLLGCDLPCAAEVPTSCFFLGSKGCKLTGRYYFCLHYFCPDLMKHLGEERVQFLLTTLGRELSVGWQLEQALRKWLSGQGYLP